MRRRLRAARVRAAHLVPLALIALLMSAPVRADEPEPGSWLDDHTYQAADGTLRALVRPEFRSAPELKADLEALKLEGLEVRLVTPWVARPREDPKKPPPPPEPGRLLLVGVPQVVESALAHVGALDVPPRMVEISMLITEVSCHGDVSEGATLALARGALADPDDTIFRGFDSRFDPEAWLDSELSGARPFEGSGVLFADNDLLGMAWESSFRMLLKRGEAELFSWPTLVCTEQEPATLDVLETVWIAQPTDAAPTQLTRLISEHEVGLRLAVRALRVGTDTATLDVDVRLKIPEALERPDTRPDTLGFRDRRVTTRVTLRDREPLLLGGLYMRRFATLKKGIPVIERMMLLDALTGSHDRQVIDTELIFLIQGRIRALPVPEHGIEDEPFPDLLRDPELVIPNPQPIDTWRSKRPLTR